MVVVGVVVGAAVGAVVVVGVGAVVVVAVAVAVVAMMLKPLKLDRDGKLHVPEDEAERTIRAFLEARGWTYIETKAEHVKRSGASAHKRYTLDAVAVHAVAARAEGAWEEAVLFLELKARRAKTERQRLKGQTNTAAELRQRGFLVYQAREDDPQPIESFQEWYRENFC